MSLADVSVDSGAWRDHAPEPARLFTPRECPGDAATLLEAGRVLVITHLAFEAPPLGAFRAPGAGAKNVSYDPASGRLKGLDDPVAAAALAPTLAAYARWARAVVERYVSRYADALTLGKTSFRPRPADAPMSLRKDDRRLHIDAFPSQPAQGRRILRVFRNINPSGESRVWRLGEDFPAHASRFLPACRRLAPGEPLALQLLGLTKARRTPYDQLMLGLHDAAKRCEAYQAEADGTVHAFAPGATWIVFSDAVPHATLAGRFALEQTFFLPVSAMANPDASPLRILERMTRRRLA